MWVNRYTSGSDHSGIDHPFHIAECFAQLTEIEIVPSFAAQSIRLIDRTLGPFRPELPITVPLWFALQLRSLNKCQIIFPSWLDVQSLASAIKAEKDSTNFTSLPYHYIEISRLLSIFDSDDISHASQIEELISDLQDLRSNKIRRGVLAWTPNEATTTRMNNISCIEIQQMKHFTQKALDNFRQIHTLGLNGQQSLSQSQSQSQSQSRASPESSESQPGAAQSSLAQRQRAFRQR